jgi:hypothetical protein
MSRSEIWGELSDEEKASTPPRRRPDTGPITSRFAPPQYSEEGMKQIHAMLRGDAFEAGITHKKSETAHPETRFADSPYTDVHGPHIPGAPGNAPLR